MEYRAAVTYSPKLQTWPTLAAMFEACSRQSIDRYSLNLSQCSGDCSSICLHKTSGQSTKESVVVLQQKLSRSSFAFSSSFCFPFWLYSVPFAFLTSYLKLSIMWFGTSSSSSSGSPPRLLPCQHGAMLKVSALSTMILRQNQPSHLARMICASKYLPLQLVWLWTCSAPL